MGNKKNHLYQVLLITGIAVTIFSLWGILVVTSYRPLVPADTPVARDSAPGLQHTPQHTSRPRTTLRAVHTAQNSCDPCDGGKSIRATAPLSDPLY